MRKDVEFKTQDGLTLAAWHYLPDLLRCILPEADIRTAVVYEYTP